MTTENSELQLERIEFRRRLSYYCYSCQVIIVVPQCVIIVVPQCVYCGINKGLVDSLPKTSN